MAPTEILIKDPCPAGLPETLTVAPYASCIPRNIVDNHVAPYSMSLLLGSVGGFWSGCVSKNSRKELPSRFVDFNMILAVFTTWLLTSEPCTCTTEEASSGTCF